MSLTLKYFTIDEANALLPLIRDIFLEAQDTKLKIEKKVDDWRKVHKTLGPADEAVLRGQVDFLANQLETQLGKISELGCLPKDLDMGLVDFAARINGREAYLCWKMEEASVRFWHGLTEGYGGRREITNEDKVESI